MKSLLLMLLGLCLAGPAFSEVNTDNTPEVEQMERLLFGSQNAGKEQSIDVSGKTQDGADCKVFVGASPRGGLGVTIVYTVKGETTNVAFDASLSAKRSRHLQVSSVAGTLQASTVALDSDERDNTATKEAISLTYELNGVAETADIRSVTIMNNSVQDWAEGPEPPASAYKPENAVTITCTVGN